MPESRVTESRVTESSTHVSCAVCPHARHEHDPLGARYCAATMAAALTRGCICR
ncbi:RGCVC family protein [Lentzea sp. NPDC055074]